MSEAEDRISNLPDSLLYHILSFAGTRDAVRASVLSKRWLYIWRSTPTLHFWCQSTSQVDKFMDIVDTTLELHDESNIQQFCLLTDVPVNETRIEKWISAAVSHNVKDIGLRMIQRDPVLMPPSLCTCDSLVSLTVYIYPNICFPKHISLPRLSSLNLCGVEFRDESWNEQLFSSCPVLEFLSLGYCNCSNMTSFGISNTALKYLNIINPEEKEDGFRHCALKIDAPNLKSLTYAGRIAKDYVLSSFPTLVSANIHFFCEEEEREMLEHKIDCSRVVRKFLRAIAHVVRLRISDLTLQVLSVAEDLLKTLPTFHNLHNLGLIGKVTADKALIALLETAPNLESLQFEGPASGLGDDGGEEDQDDEPDDDDSGDDGGEDNNYEDSDGDSGDADGEDNHYEDADGDSGDDCGEDDHYNEDDDSGDDGGEDNHYKDEDEAVGIEDNDDNEDNGWTLDMVDTRCSFSNLKFVRFQDFTGNAREMSWVHLILKNAKALEEMDISFDSVSHGKSKKLMADISSVPRASANCVFKFSSKQG